nr:oxidoreductase-like domain-containing protein [Noviherbaspirillum galbum]
MAELQHKLDRLGIVFRDPPEEPTTCCGRGCNGCVWEGYLHAAGYWCEQARDLVLAGGAPGPA